MANLTISVNDEVLRRARIRALEENTSVNAVLGKYLEAYSRLDEARRARQKALKRLLRIADEHPIDRGGESWNRERLHER
jgi:hypothetical protein